MKADVYPALSERFRAQFGKEPDPRIWVMEVLLYGEAEDIAKRRDAAEIKLALDCGLRPSTKLADFPSGTAAWEWIEMKGKAWLVAVVSREAAES